MFFKLHTWRFWLWNRKKIGNKDAITDNSHTNRQGCVSNKDSRQLNCPCFSVSRCRSVSLCYYLTLSSVTSLLCLKFLLLFFIHSLPSTLSSLISHHYSFSKSLLSFLKYASPHVPHEVVCVCNLGWLTLCESWYVFVRCRAQIPTASSSLSEHAGDQAVQGLIVWRCVCVSALSHCKPGE